MKEQVRFRVYTVNQCGYYKRGGQSPEFGDLNEVFTQIKAWIKGKSIRRTGTYQFREGDNIYPTFCHSILCNDFGDYLVTTWNQTPTGEKALASIAGDELVGEAQVALAKIPRGNIPGYPTYFWIVPDENKLITIQPHGSNQNGVENLRKYILNFMLFYSPFSVRKATNNSPESTEISILGYSPNSPNIPPQGDVSPRFESFLYERSNRNIEYVRQRLNLVRKIFNKRELNFSIDYEADFLEKAFSFIGIREIPTQEKKAKFIYELDFESLTEKQFATIIDSWEKHLLETDNNWDDIGFQLEGEDRVCWLNKFYMSKSFVLKLQKENEEMIKPESIMQEICERRAEFLKSLES